MPDTIATDTPVTADVQTTTPAAPALAPVPETEDMANNDAFTLTSPSESEPEQAQDADVKADLDEYMAAPARRPNIREDTNNLRLAIERQYIMDRDEMVRTCSPINSARMQAMVYMFLIDGGDSRDTPSRPFCVTASTFVHSVECFKEGVAANAYPLVPVSFVAQMLGVTTKAMTKRMAAWVETIGLNTQTFFIRQPLVIVDPAYAGKQVPCDTMSGTYNDQQYPQMAQRAMKVTPEVLMARLFARYNNRTQRVDVPLPVGLKYHQKGKWISGEDFIMFMVMHDQKWAFEATFALGLAVRARQAVANDIDNHAKEKEPIVDSLQAIFDGMKADKLSPETD